MPIETSPLSTTGLRVPVRTSVVPYPLASANDALRDLRAGAFQGAAVLVP